MKMTFILLLIFATSSISLNSTSKASFDIGQVSENNTEDHVALSTALQRESGEPHIGKRLSFIGKKITSMKSFGYKDWAGTAYGLVLMKKGNNFAAFSVDDNGIIVDEIFDSGWLTIETVRNKKIDVADFYLIKLKSTSKTTNMIALWEIDPKSKKFIKITDLTNYEYEPYEP